MHQNLEMIKQKQDFFTILTPTPAGCFSSLSSFQSEHLYFRKKVRIWLIKPNWSKRATVSSGIKRLFGNIIQCQRWAWRLRWSRRANFFPQRRHSKGFSPVWVLTWRFSSSALANRFEQLSQLHPNGCSPKWYRFIWAFR